MSSISQKRHLQRLLAIHRRNLQNLEEQKALKGLSAEPWLHRQIECELKAIVDIESKLNELEKAEQRSSSGQENIMPLSLYRLAVDLQSAVGGRYEIIESIGTGTMKRIVFKACDTLLNRLVAIKVCVRYLEDDDSVDLFMREAQIAASLTHPNIIAVYDSGVTKHGYYYVMEFVDGESLEHILRKTGPLGLAQALSIATQVCDALSVAHKAGVIHRAVMPRSILVSSNGQVKLMDFVVALFMHDERFFLGGQHVVGNPTYMSPEQIRGQTLDGRSDLYSLGVVLFEAVTGVPPFQGTNIYSVLYKHLHAQIPEIGSHIPHEARAIIRKALSKDANDRWRSAEEMGRALRAVLNSLPSRQAQG